MRIQIPVHSRIVKTVVVLSATAGLVVFAALPIHRQISREHADIQGAYAKMENSQKRVLRLPELREQYEKISESQGRGPSLLPESGIVDLIESLETLAVSTGGELSVSQGNDLEAVRKSATKGKQSDQQASGRRIADDLPDGRTLGLTVSYVGRYAGIADFFRRLETVPYFLDVVSVDIRPGASEVADRSGVFTDSESVKPADAGPDRSVRAVISLVVYLE